MIGSFWNLCRACPSMPLDKQLHSEYRSTYRWHEFTGNSRPEVVRNAPIPNQFGPTNEPPLPRRKKCPELAYKSHEFIMGTEQISESRKNVIASRARSAERGASSRRSKSEGPPAITNGKANFISTEIKAADIGDHSIQPGESNGLFKKTISKLSTEYRLQFVWPTVRQTFKGQLNGLVEVPKKSKSMGAIKPTNTIPTVHNKKTSNQKEAILQELEPLVSMMEEKQSTEKQVTLRDNRANCAFLRTVDEDKSNHLATRKKSDGFEHMKGHHFPEQSDNKQTFLNEPEPPQNLEAWYKEVLELRKKAGEYKTRGWGMEIDPKLYKTQTDLWDQVSKRSSLSALSLATSIHRPISKEEKEQENNKKFIPSKSVSKTKVPGQARLIDNKDEFSLSGRYNSVRHHLERTTGADIEEGALLPSPTREKLMPTIPKPRESESQRGSPKKSSASKHGSPQKGSPQKASPQKASPKKTIKNEGNVFGKDTGIAIANHSPLKESGKAEEPIVKSPPEPTRVKSPEQIIMRSPDPVNWTVPLDTGKIFTVTQNVKDEENYGRPQSEIQASTPVDRPPPAPQSAPPELTEQAKMDAWKVSDLIAPRLLDSPKTSEPKTNISGDSISNLKFDKTVPESTFSGLNDPLFIESTTSSVRSTATDVLEKARDRFDRFWGSSKEDNV